MRKYVVQLEKYNPKKQRSDISFVNVMAHNKMDAVRTARDWLDDTFTYAERPRVGFDNDRMSQVWEYEEPLFIESTSHMYA